MALGASLWGTAWAGVTEEAEGQALLLKARQALAPLGMQVDREILVKLRTRDELQVENTTRHGRTLELNGFYIPYNPESIWVVSNLSEPELLGTLAHELTHAWQSTEAPQQDRKLCEGFARWCEYHVLQAAGHSARAAGLLRDPDPDYGGGLRFLVNLEAAQGAAAVIEYARTRSRIE